MFGGKTHARVVNLRRVAKGYSQTHCSPDYDAAYFFWFVKDLDRPHFVVSHPKGRYKTQWPLAAVASCSTPT
jgi:hypothetical protein